MATHALQCTPAEFDICKNHTALADATHPNVSYKNVVCKKPWGYEFLVYESKKIGIWCLTVHAGHATSLHTHFHKDTFLLVLEGCAKITRYNQESLILHPMESVHIPKHVFHGVGSFSPSTTILEIEIFDTTTNFSDKNDVLRINDLYGRMKTGYEQSITRELELESYDYFSFEHTDIKRGNTQFEVQNKINPKANINILLHSPFYDSKTGLYIQEGSILSSSMTPPNSSSILSVLRPYSEEEKKIVYCAEQRDLLVKQLKQNKQTIVLTSGCYDIVHVGHLSHLQRAKQLGDVLMVCLSSDEQIRAIKGEGRPINHYEDRITFFQTIPYVDYIVLYNEEHLESEGTLGSIMRAIAPDIWVKGSDYTKEAILTKHPYLQRIEIFENIINKSTTKIVNKIKQSSN